MGRGRTFENELPMGKPRKTPGRVHIPADTLADLNAGTRQSANLVEGLAVEPDVGKRPVLHIVEAQMLDRLRRVTGQDFAGRIDIQAGPAPAPAFRPGLARVWQRP